MKMDEEEAKGRSEVKRGKIIGFIGMAAWGIECA
jgi:hypothetical protein